MKGRVKEGEESKIRRSEDQKHKLLLPLPLPPPCTPLEPIRSRAVQPTKAQEPITARHNVPLDQSQLMLHSNVKLTFFTRMSNYFFFSVFFSFFFFFFFFFFFTLEYFYNFCRGKKERKSYV